jgi:hypothetical protein
MEIKKSCTEYTLKIILSAPLITSNEFSGNRIFSNFPFLGNNTTHIDKLPPILAQTKIKPLITTILYLRINISTANKLCVVYFAS